MRERLKRAGYQAHAWTESLAATSGGLESVLRDFRKGDPETWRKLLDPEYRDLGIGLDRVGRTPLYTFLFAVPQADWFARRTAGLHDLARVRAEMLASVNAERKKAGARPLRPERPPRPGGPAPCRGHAGPRLLRPPEPGGEERARAVTRGGL